VSQTLKPLQVDFYNRLRAARASGARIIVAQAATGFGKNTVAAFMCQQAMQKNVPTLFMVHRRRLVDQISERLREFTVPHGVIMRGKGSNSSHLVQVASRDTLISRCVNNEWLDMPPAGLLIVDEAHLAAAPKSEYRRIIGHYPAATVLLLTATPVGPDGAGLGPWAQSIVCAAPTTQLVREGYLVPVKIFAPARKRKGKRLLKGIAGDLVESWQQYGEDRPTVLFCARVQHSLDAVKAYQEQGITAAHIDADTPDDERDRIFDDVRAGRIKILSNVGIVGVGFDLPELGTCQFFCNVGSRVRWIQGMGRVMRTAEGKEYGIGIDHGGNVFDHGFTDEDTEWTLLGNVDAKWKEKHAAGETEKAYYCKHCELAYHGQKACPQCGRAPAKPPKSIFEAPPVRSRNEILTEAERTADAKTYSREEKIKTWFACLGMAAHRNGTFKMASRQYHNKYGQWPDADFPCLPPWEQRGEKVSDVHPNFGRKKVQS